MTSSPSTEPHVAQSLDLSFSAFADELEKLAEAKHPTLKRWAKNTALIGAGYGVGHGAGMLAEKGLQTVAGGKWRKWQSPAKSKILRAGAGVSMAATFLAAENLLRQRSKAEEK